MSHEIYRTKGIVFGKGDFGEADRFLYILTEEFGLVSVIAKGVRNIKSKLRHNLDLLTRGNFCLVRGRDAWRLIDAESHETLNCKMPNCEMLGRLANFLIRMIKGEERNDFIWKRITHLMDFLKTHESVSDAEVVEIEENAVGEILHNLGYMESVPKSRKLLIPAINRAIKESML